MNLRLGTSARVSKPCLVRFSDIRDQNPYSADNVIETNLSYLNGEGESPDVRGKGWERLTIIIQ